MSEERCCKSCKHSHRFNISWGFDKPPKWAYICRRLPPTRLSTVRYPHYSSGGVWKDGHLEYDVETDFPSIREEWICGEYEEGNLAHQE